MSWLHLLRIDMVIFPVGTYEADVDYSTRVEDPCHDAIVVVSDSEYNPVASNYAGIGIALDDVYRSSPIRLCHFSIPYKQRLLGFRMTLPEFPKRSF